MTHIVRAFVVALTLTGAAASIHTPNAAGPVRQPKPDLPVPMCPPNDPNACNIVIKW